MENVEKVLLNTLIKSGCLNVVPLWQPKQKAAQDRFLYLGA